MDEAFSFAEKFHLGGVVSLTDRNTFANYIYSGIIIWVENRPTYTCNPVLCNRVHAASVLSCQFGSFTVYCMRLLL